MIKQNNILIIIFAAILVILLIQPGGITNTQNNVNNVINSITNSGGSAPVQEQDKGIKVSFGLYDSNGHKINPNKGTFSIVGTTPGVTYIDFTITVPNTGAYALSCDLVSLSPTALSNAVTKTTKSILIGGKTAWSSSKILASQFESTTATTFNVTVRCSYNPGNGTNILPDKSASIPLSIKPDGSGASFEVQIDTGGTPTEFCGDGTCQVTETSSTCPGDCAVANNVRFRTSDLSYLSGSAVAFASTCGSNLTRYGYSGSSGTLTGDCASASKTWCGSVTLALSNLPGEYKTGAANPSLWITSDATTICICDDGSDGKYFFKKYLTSDSDASKVDNTQTSYDSSKEVSC
jgi:hypothetical protein